MNIKQLMLNIESLRKNGAEDLALKLEASIQDFTQAEAIITANKRGPFSPEQVEVKSFLTKDGKTEYVVGVGFKKLGPAMWIKYLSNPDTVARILELSHAQVAAKATQVA
jgi:hypothetical protein